VTAHEVALIVLAALAVERRLPAAPPGPVAEATEPGCGPGGRQPIRVMRSCGPGATGA
jgi:hypothetical protein